jgi:hypothetical protein
MTRTKVAVIGSGTIGTDPSTLAFCATPNAPRSTTDLMCAKSQSRSADAAGSAARKT